MIDVATYAGVSSQTVSRVINGSSSVRPATRARVVAAVEELGYLPNAAARALVTRRSRTIGVVSFGTRLYGPTSMVFGIEQAAREAGFFVSVASEPTIDALTLRRALHRLGEQVVEGVVVIAPQKQAQLALTRLSPDVPAVVVDGHDVDGPPRVFVDHFSGAREATRHLLAQGVRTVHHVAGPSDWVEAEERLEGWSSVLREAGAVVHEPLRGDWSAASGYAAGRELARDPAVEAVFVANDHMALGLLKAFAEAGRDVPSDCLVVGFDGSPEAEFFRPALTTVHQDFSELGQRSVHLLLAQITGGPAPLATSVTAGLVVRASSVRRGAPALLGGGP